MQSDQNLPWTTHQSSKCCFYIPNVMCTSVFLRIECLHDRENWENSKFSDKITKILCDKISRNYSLEHLIGRANQLEVCHIDCFIFLWNRLCQPKTKRVKGTFWCRDCYSNSLWRDSGRETLRHWDVSGNKLSHCSSTRCAVNSLGLEKHRSHIFLKKVSVSHNFTPHKASPQEQNKKIIAKATKCLKKLM